MNVVPCKSVGRQQRHRCPQPSPHRHHSGPANSLTRLLNGSDSGLGFSKFLKNMGRPAWLNASYLGAGLILLLAVEQSQAANLVVNGDGESGTSGWTAGSGDAIANDGVGGNPGGDIAVTSGDSSGTATQCVDLSGDGSTFYLISVDFNMSNYTTTGNTAGGLFEFFSSSDCSSGSIKTVFRVSGSPGSGQGNMNTWYTVANAGNENRDGANSILVTIGHPFGSSAGHITLIDNVIVGPEGTPVELTTFSVD